ncbi:hypothetical protein KQI63_06485 [bacterium]|nr:hypothetical protein [bacterium]
MRLELQKGRDAINNRNPWAIASVVLGAVGPPGFVTRLTNDPILWLLSVLVGFILVPFTLALIGRNQLQASATAEEHSREESVAAGEFATTGESVAARESVAAEEHIREMRRYVLEQSHLGCMPAITRVAKLSTANFTTTIGFDVKLNEYLAMLQESADYEHLRDVTFLARVEPSDWGREEDGGQKGMAWVFLRNLGRIKDKHPNIKMRRILVLEDSIHDVEKQKTEDYNYFKNKHKEVKVDLIHMTPAQLASARLTMRPDHQNGDWQEDIAVFIGEDDDHRGWILESNYNYNMDPSPETIVKTWMWRDENVCMEHFPRLFAVVCNLYNYEMPGQFIHRVQEDGYSNAPDQDYLLKSCIITSG